MMKKILILSAATLVLSSCGIYNKYKPVSEVPEGLYGSETVASADTANFGNL
ncbi:TolC family protein, partial [Bacteroides thetaiotaomicron]